jgi:hypothetical protein
MLEFRKLGEVTDSEMEADPLVVLPCSHAFLMSTADGFMDLAAFYSRDPEGRWVRMQRHVVVKCALPHHTMGVLIRQMCGLNAVWSDLLFQVQALALQWFQQHISVASFLVAVKLHHTLVTLPTATPGCTS